MSRNFRTTSGSALELAEVYAVAAWWRELGTPRGVARMTGVDPKTVRKLVNHGLPSRGVPPLRLVQPEDLPPLPPSWKQSQGSIPVGSSGALMVEDSEAGVDDAPAPLQPQAIVMRPAPRKQPGAPGAPGKAPGRPAPAPGSPQPPPAPSAGPQSPPALPPGPVAPPMPVVPGSDVGHTLQVANAEIVRVSRHARTLFNARIRGVAKLQDRLRGDLTGKDAPRLSKSERDLLMVLREVRLSGLEVERLYRLERDILGVGAGAGVNTPAPGQEDEGPQLGASDSLTVEELTAQVRHLLGENPNLAPPEGATASTVGGAPVTMDESVLDPPRAHPGASASRITPPDPRPAWMREDPTEGSTDGR